MLASFILAIDDSMDAILDWIRHEGLIFRGGSGSGINLSSPRSSQPAALEGRPRLRPGLVHARCRRLRRHDQVGWQDAPRGEDGRVSTSTIPTSKSSRSVQGEGGAQGARARAAGLRHVARFEQLELDPVPEREQLGPRQRRVHGGRGRRHGVEPDGRTTARSSSTVDARKLLKHIADAAWQCAHPGVQYDTTINEWHTCPNTGRINGSNPCFPGDARVHTTRACCRSSSWSRARRGGEEIRVYTHHATGTTRVGASSATVPTR